MSAPVFRGYGRLTVGGVNDTVYPVDLPNRKLGDILCVYAFGVNVFSTNAGGPDAPPGFEVIYSQDDPVVFERVWATRVVNVEAKLTIPKGPDTFVGAWMTIAWVITNVTPLPTWRDDDAWSIAFYGLGIDPVTVSGDDRLVVYMINGFEFYVDPVAIQGPPGFDAIPLDPADEPIADYSGVFNRIAFRTITTDTTVTNLDVLYEDPQRAIGISFIGLDSTPLPALPQFGQVRLDCAKSYRAFITGADYRTRIDAVGWQSIKWGRILDEPSTASVVVPDITGGVGCCIRHGGLKPWKFGLLIERNDLEVWSGPITKLGRDPEGQTTTIAAGDVFARYAKRFAVRNATVEWENTDAGVALAGLINSHARSSTDAWYTPCPSVFTGAGVTRKLIPSELTMASDVIDDLLGSAVDAFVANGLIYVWEAGEGWRYVQGYKKTVEGPYNTNYDLVFGLFTREAFTKLPSWDVDGMSMGNYIAIPSADTGELGFRQIWTAEDADSQLEFGDLDFMEPNTLNMPEDAAPSEIEAVLQARANTVRDLHAQPPTVISGGTLAEGAPVGINDLIPGSIWIMDIFDACYGQLRVASRLKSIDVSVALGEGGPVETVSPTMFPPGFEGGEL